MKYKTSEDRRRYTRWELHHVIHEVTTYVVTDTKVKETVDNHYNVSNLSEVTKFFKYEFNVESFLIVLSRAEVARWVSNVMKRFLNIAFKSCSGISLLAFAAGSCFTSTCFTHHYVSHHYVSQQTCWCETCWCLTSTCFTSTCLTSTYKHSGL